MDITCSTYAWILGEGRPEGKNHWKNLGVCGRTIGKWIFKDTLG